MNSQKMCYCPDYFGMYVISTSESYCIQRNEIIGAQMMNWTPVWADWPPQPESYSMP